MLARRTGVNPGTIGAARRFGCYRIQSGPCAIRINRSFLTRSEHSPPSITALRKVHSITSSARIWIAIDSSTPIALAVLRLMIQLDEPNP
jgi:hypothetical protein